MKKIGHHLITGTIVCKSGLRIGGSDELLQTGATDLTCIKHPVTLEPYIPGTSLKGRLRSEMEQRKGTFGGKNNNEPCDCGKCMVCRVFGPHKVPRHELGPTRLIVRDAGLVEGGDLEVKSENVIDRKVGAALSPRKVERVAAGAAFDFRLAVQEWDLDRDCTFTDDRGKQHAGQQALLEFVRTALRRVERTGLGAGVSKGYGEIAFRDLKLDRDGGSGPEPFTL
jgi:CRISPR-associated protein Csm3